SVPAPVTLRTVSLHDALPISPRVPFGTRGDVAAGLRPASGDSRRLQSEAPGTSGSGGFFVCPTDRRIDDQNHRSIGARALREHRSEEHTSELQSRENLVCRLL